MDNLRRLLVIMARLRDPTSGCPWDQKQTFASIAPYTLEEAYEVVEAIELDDTTALRDELGDLLFQVVFHARMAEEQKLFGFDDVAAAAAEKMERRHPHVFADAKIDSAEQQTLAWTELKAKERNSHPSVKENVRPSQLDHVSTTLPALSRAKKLQQRAAEVGFDWTDLDPVLDKIAEELEEVRTTIKQNEGPERLAEEIGDLLFACSNAARLAGFDAETLLRAANRKFEKRFRSMETRFHSRNQTLQSASLAEMEAVWQQIKQMEKQESQHPTDISPPDTTIS